MLQGAITTMRVCGGGPIYRTCLFCLSTAVQNAVTGNTKEINEAN